MQEIEKRPVESYTIEDIKNINLLSFTKNGAVPFGSATYKIQKYPGDLDLYEIFIERGIDKTISDFKTILVNKVKRIIQLKCHWITEVKAGIDKRFDLSIGKLEMGIYTPNYQNLLEMYKIAKNDEGKDYNELFYLYNFLSPLQNSHFEILENCKKTQEEYSTISEIIRNRKILRWKPQDIINERIIQNGKIISLLNALHDNSSVKIDMITYLDNRFTEVTNFFFLAAYCGNDLCLINTSYNFTDPKESIQNFKEQIKIEIESLFYNSDNFFKGVKRMWAYSRSIIVSSPSLYHTSLYNKGMEENERGYEKAIIDLSPLISGNISMVYQIKSEIEAILLIISSLLSKNEKEKEKCIGKILKQIEGWKVSFSHVTEWDNKFLLELYSLLDSISEFFVIFKKSQKEEVIIKFELLKEILKKKINQMTMQELINIGYYPIPQLFLPYPRRYV